MKQLNHHKYSITVNLKGKPSSQNDIDLTVKYLKSKFRGNLNFVLVILALAIGVAFRAITLQYDNDLELFQISLYIGFFFGLFAGSMIDGGIKRKSQVAIVGIIFCSSASLCSSMLMTLMVGHLTDWISSINMLASALAGMWLMTYYDEVLKGLDSVKDVNRQEFLYIKKASSHFEELNTFTEQIREQDRMPLVAEYWAFRDWIKQKASQ